MGDSRCVSHRTLPQGSRPAYAPLDIGADSLATQKQSPNAGASKQNGNAETVAHCRRSELTAFSRLARIVVPHVLHNGDLQKGAA